MDATSTQTMNIFDKPTAYDNGGRELRILEAVQALDLTRPPFGFGRGLSRTRGWRITGIATEDLDVVASAVWSIVPSARVFSRTGEIEWQNL